MKIGHLRLFHTFVPLKPLKQLKKGSPRKEGNSDLLARQFAKGAEESGNESPITKWNLY